MKSKACILLFILAALSGCASYQPPFAQDSVHRLPPLKDKLQTSTPTLKITYLGNTTLLFEDEENTIMIDGFVSRPNAKEIVFKKISPNECVIRQHLHALNVKRLDAILVGHSHYDHVLDAPLMAQITEAVLIGPESVLNVGRTLLGESQLRLAEVNKPIKGLGDFTVTMVPCVHSDYPVCFLDDLLFGHSDVPFESPAHVTEYKTPIEEVFSFHISHKRANILVQVSANSEQPSLRKYDASIIFLCVASMDKMKESERDDYWNAVVKATAKGKPCYVIPVHWDDFTTKLKKGRSLKPRKLQDLRSIAKYLDEKANSHETVTVIWMDAMDQVEI